MHHCNRQHKRYTRRDFFTKTSLGLGALSLSSLLDPIGLFGKTPTFLPGNGGILGKPHFAPKAKRVIYLFQSGAPFPIGSIRLQAPFE